MYIRTTIKSQMLRRATDIQVFLPFHDGYPGAKTPFPTLYFLPGYSANAEEIITCLPLRQMGARYGIAIVVPDGENSFYSDHPERATLNGSFVAQELVQVTRRLFPLLSNRREDTFIGGISMGGYGAAVHGLHNSATFARILMMSPAIEADRLFDPADDDKPGAVPSSLFTTLLGGREAYLNSYMNPLHSIANLQAAGMPLPRMLLCCGKQDTLVYEACAHFRKTLAEAGVPLGYEEGDGGHDIPYWDAHLESCFRFLKAE
ncbi:MAG: hypothetical protein LBM74_02495 [Oscillospiraceae bacterium]|jgi:S-formylglutathione hydrolase FrmB|nr:hypothetical protein [Oscillospiraceae bacterium]